VSVVKAQDKAIDSLVAVLRTLPNDTNRVKCLIELALNYSDADIAKVFEVAHEALTLSKRIQYDKGIADAYGYLGSAYADAGNNGKAIECFLEALHITERRNDLRNSALNYHDIAGVYIEENKFEEGLRYYQKAMDIWHRLGSERGPVTVLYNMGYLYQKQNKDTLAVEYYKQAINKGKAINNIIPVIFSLVNTSAIYLKYKEYAKARETINEAYKLVPQNSSDNIMAEIYGVYSDIYMAEGKYDQALIAIEKGLAIAKSSHKSAYILQNYKRLASVHQAMGNSSKAYKSLSRYTELSDSLNAMSSKVSIEQMVHGYELEMKDLQVASQIQQYEAGIFRRNAFIGVLACLLLVGFLIYSRMNLILKAKQQQLKYYTRNLLEKSTIIEEISEELDAVKNYPVAANEKMEKFGQILRLKIHTDEDWENFKTAFEEVYPKFFGSLRYKYPDITASELRLAAITKLNLSIKEASTMLGISAESVKQSRYRLKKRMDIQDGSKLKDYLEQYN
jgi:tetratricopeptide (TPR) repeat protein